MYKRFYILRQGHRLISCWRRTFPRGVYSGTALHGPQNVHFRASERGARETLFTAAARHIHCTHRVPLRDRQEAVRVIVAHVVPLC